MPSYCSIIGCKSRGQGVKKQFFRYPLSRPKVLQQWLLVMDRKGWTPKPSCRLCIDHFLPEDFVIRPNIGARLKPEAVPSIFPDVNSPIEDTLIDIENVDSDVEDDGNSIQDQENIDENIDLKQPEKSTSLIKDFSEDSNTKRPRRTSKINVKMKDFIVGDDLKKINNKPNALDSTKHRSERDSFSKIKSESSYKSNLKPTSGLNSSKVNTAKELLSILEGSDDESSHNKSSISIVDNVPQDGNNHAVSNDLKKVEENTSKRVEHKITSSNSTNKQFKRNTKRLSRSSSSSKKNSSIDLSKTYFPIKCGGNFFYFTYSDLNPVVDLSKQNKLLGKDNSDGNTEEMIKLPDISGSDSIEDIDKEQSTEKTKTIPKAIKSNEISEELNEGIIPSTTKDQVVILSENEKEYEEVETVQNDDSISSVVEEQIEIFSEYNVDLPQTSSEGMDNVEMNSSPLRKKRKRFKTVAEIVVRTDNTRPGGKPNVSIDKIVDFKSSGFKSSRNVKPRLELVDKIDTNNEVNNDANKNEDESQSEDELSRLGERITETIRKMKLLEKIKDDTSKLTVLITTLPQVTEKEMLIVKKKNIETNIVQSRELQVVISSNKSSDPISYTILPVNNNINQYTISDTNTKFSVENEHFNLTSLQEHIAVVTQSQHKEIAENRSTDSDNHEILDPNNDGNEQNSSEVIIHDHAYLSPNIKVTPSNPSVPHSISEGEMRESPSKAKLSENEVVFRNKVSKKLRSLKDTVKKKSDTISKLKDKIKYLERTLKDSRRNKKSFKKENGTSIRNDMFYGVDELVDTSELSSLNNKIEGNSDDSDDDDDERECSSPITYLCEPAIEAEKKSVHLDNDWNAY